MFLKNNGCVNPKTGKPWSSHTVFQDLTHIREEWKKQASSCVTEKRAQILAELGEVKRVAWQKGRVNEVLNAIKKECDILGVDEARKVETTVKGDPNAPIHHSQSVDLSKLSLDELKFLEGIMNKANPKDFSEIAKGYTPQQIKSLTN